MACWMWLSPPYFLAICAVSRRMFTGSLLGSLLLLGFTFTWLWNLSMVVGVICSWVWVQFL